MKQEYIEHPHYTFIENCHGMFDVIVCESEYPEDGYIGVAICHTEDDAASIARALNQMEAAKRFTTSSV